jgi:hypothetical protein
MKKQIEYVSEMTRFIRELHEQKPHLAEEQRKARALVGPCSRPRARCR